MPLPKGLSQEAQDIVDEVVIDHEHAKALDAKLRLLLTDIDPFWIRWRYVGEKQGWLQSYTDKGKDDE